ncbi:MAG: hypothetical protein J5I90_03460 [Caldilineales bacterium]|nr:hypothetical protein [Caldilineales bacterium]
MPAQSFEQEIKEFFARHNLPFHDHSTDAERFQRLDFGFGPPGRYFSFDAKEKRQPYNLKNWPDSGIAEERLFIVDDLAARKILGFAPNSGLLVRDNVRPAYYLFTVLDLYLMPKLRVNRPIRNKQTEMKGKWLVDLRNGWRYATLAEAFAGIEKYLDEREQIFSRELACYGDYVGEEIGEGGIVRQPGHWREDIGATR